MDTLEIAKIHMARPFSCGGELIEAAFLAAPLDGMYLDFGLSTGRTINIVVPNFHTPRLYPFDSFRPTEADWVMRQGKHASFLHIDSGIYNETRRTLFALMPSLWPGSVLVFDGYCNYPGWEREDYRAWQELVSASGLSYCYLGFVPSNRHASIKITGRAPWAT